MSDGRPHGNAKYHLEKCRCPVCTQAARDYENNRYRAIAYGRWQPFVDAEPVRQHLRSLGEFGIGWIRAAKLAGVSTGGVSKILYGDRPRGLAPTKRVRPETALKILAVEPTLANLGARTPIDATGTRRRLQALVAKGWTQSELARRLGADRANFARTIVSNLVEAGTIRAVLALYDELWRLDPVEHGVPRIVPRMPADWQKPRDGRRSGRGTTTPSTTPTPSPTGPVTAEPARATRSTTTSACPCASRAEKPVAQIDAAPPPQPPEHTKAPPKRG